MSLSEDNQQKLKQLMDMFSEVPVARIRSVCQRNAWNVEQCIDKLVNKNSDVKTETSSSKAADYFNSNTTNTSWRDTANYNLNYQQGAIPKKTNCVQDESVKLQGPNIRIQPKTMEINQVQNSIRNNPTTEQKLVDQIIAGYKVMIIMRGAPGSGKSFLASSLVEKGNLLNGAFRLEDFVLSTDDYFYDSSGRYKYNVGKLDDAHNFNQRRVRDKAAAGWSPIIVDNTNMKLWEMMPYVQTAVRHGYILQLLEPNTPWKLSAGKLAMKNRHRVAREKIQIMLDKYEKGTASDVIKMLKDTRYTLPLPQMRSLPPILIASEEMDTNETFNDFNNAENVYQWAKKPVTDVLPTNNEAMAESEILTKPQRTKLALKLDENEVLNTQPIQENQTIYWKPFEQEANQFWATSQEVGSKEEVPLRKLSADSTKNEKTLLDLLREGVNDMPEKTHQQEAVSEEKVSFKRHKTGCPNENKSFASLRQIYPNKQLHGLWDLFIKCNGDIDWAVDILLKEDELSMCYEDQYKPTEDDENVFNCACTIDGEQQSAIELPHQAAQTLVAIKPQRTQRMRSQRASLHRAVAKLEVKEAIENRFVLADEHYSVHVKKVRNMRNGVCEAEGEQTLNAKTYNEMAVQTEPLSLEDTEEDQEDDSTELLEINLGDHFVKQLSGIFMSEIMSSDLPENLKTNVFMPKSLAKELFMLWMESAYNQMEEQRQTTLREDEDFARLLKNPKYENCKESPENVKEILDMELAWMIYKSDHEQLKQMKQNQNHPTDIATHLTQMKLCEIFPNIPRETLLDVLEAHGNQFNETVATLQSNMDRTDFTTMSSNILLQRAMQENELLNNQIEVGQQHFPSTHSISNYVKPIKLPLQPDEAKRLALRDFEDTRNYAAHHSQLKAECYQKARDAIQKGNSSIAVYYSQIANLHKKKIDMYNHRAANCIMEVHKYTQNNPDLLDLHYLHVLEAVGCLDIFLDRHLTSLRSLAKCYKHVFIITGRGLHSSGGVSIIKNKVKSRLKERCLRWSEVNPGLLKVKLFSASRYSKNI